MTHIVPERVENRFYRYVIIIIAISVIVFWFVFKIKDLCCYLCVDVTFTLGPGGGQRHFWHFLPVIPNFWQVPNFLRCQKCRKCQTFKKSPSILCTIDSLAHLTHIWECSRDLYRVFTNVSQIYVLRLQMQLIRDQFRYLHTSNSAGQRWAALPSAAQRCPAALPSAER